jgi:GNAT superfamily N-acetyltransferase
LYANYLRERTHDEIIETDTGFATYRFLNEKQVYIVDIFVLPEHRKLNDASAMADSICKLAKERGCNELVGSVVPSTKNSTTSLKVLLGYGMRLDSAANDLIVFKKEL